VLIVSESQPKNIYKLLSYLEQNILFILGLTLTVRYFTISKIFLRRERKKERIQKKKERRGKRKKERDRQKPLKTWMCERIFFFHR
jgi:hypothetical protein